MDRHYLEAKDLPQALALLEQHPDAGIVAGGTDIVVGHRSAKKALPETLLAIHRLSELQRIDVPADGSLRIGALVTHRQLESSPVVRERFPALSDASALVGSPATRQAGTIGGNICNASPAMEVGSPLLISSATVELASASGTRVIPLSEFVTGPGKTSRKPGELLTVVIIPAAAGYPESARMSSGYVRLEYRQAMEIAVVGAAASIVIDGRGRCLDAGIALTAVAPTCIRAAAAEQVMRGQRLSTDRINQAANAAASVARPIDDVRGSADYRRAMIPVIVRRSLGLALERVEVGNSAPVPA